jgi:DNA-binding HxlR family transcriptional regulator
MEKTVYLYDEEKFKCPVTAALEIMGGKWKPIILFVLAEEPHRFGELRRRVPKITQKMLTQALRELEKDKLVSRRIYASIPPKVEYSLTDLGRQLGPILDQVYQWGKDYTLSEIQDPTYIGKQA